MMLTRPDWFIAWTLNPRGCENVPEGLECTLSHADRAKQGVSQNGHRPGSVNFPGCIWLVHYPDRGVVFPIRKGIADRGINLARLSLHAKQLVACPPSTHRDHKAFELRNGL